ncbi:MAG TPA: type II toxin-antitoxin system prevent-host-death family antitoxin [Marmoricola sp.]|nr:type II toxin-antitoxin system prevent-host-death family antitoxin [Marmoricola sp.]
MDRFTSRTIACLRQALSRASISSFRPCGLRRQAWFLHSFLYSFAMTTFAGVHPERTLSVTAATGRGVAGLVKDAERGEDVIVERHGRAVAAVISVKHFDELHRVRADLIAASLVLARELSDTGNRTDLDDAIAAFGFDRVELETELDADIAAGRE